MLVLLYEIVWCLGLVCPLKMSKKQLTLISCISWHPLQVSTLYLDWPRLNRFIQYVNFYSAPWNWYIQMEILHCDTSGSNITWTPNVLTVSIKYILWIWNTKLLINYCIYFCMFNSILAIGYKIYIPVMMSSCWKQV